MPSTTIQFFEYEHLPQQLQAVAKPIAELAHLMEDTLPDGPEKSAGMRKLLEAKDCFVRTRVVTKEQKIQRSRIDGIYQACRAAEMATLGSAMRSCAKPSKQSVSWMILSCPSIKAVWPNYSKSHSGI